MIALSKLQVRYLAAMVELLTWHGVPAPLNVVRSHIGRDTAHTGSSSSERAVLTGLKRKGYLAQPYRSGPYLPLYDAQGRKVTVRVLRPGLPGADAPDLTQYIDKQAWKACAPGDISKACLTCLDIGQVASSSGTMPCPDCGGDS